MMRTAMVLALAAAMPAAAAQKTANLEFSYAYPAQVRAIPALRTWFDEEGALLRSASMAQAAADRRDAAKEGRPFHAYTTDRTWKVVTDTPRFLSLSMEAYDYTGGAHGNTAFAALLWDKVAKLRRQPKSLFTSAPALSTAIRADFCRRLDAQRRDKRSGESGGLPDFDKCIDPVAETIILGSSTRTRFNRIGILIAPYEAGPYSEGTYEVTVPVTPAVIEAVKPEFRAYFAATGTP